MKKQLWKKCLTTAMVIAAMAVVTACGKKEEEKVSSQNTQSEYIYQPSFQNVDMDIDYISSFCVKEDRVYTIGSKWVEDENSKNGGQQYQYFINCTVDGSDLQKNELKGISDDEYSRAFIIDDQGQFRMMTQKYEYNEKTQEGKQYYYIHTLNEAGKIKNTVELKIDEKTINEDYFDFNSNSVVLWEGKIYAASGSNIYCFNEEGKQSDVYKMEGYIDDFFQTNDGKMYVYGSSGGDYGLMEFDPETGKFGEVIKFGEYAIYNIRSIYSGDDNIIYLNDGNDVYKMDISTGKLDVEFNWLNSDIDGNYVNGCFPLEDDKFFTIDNSYDESTEKQKTEFITMNKVKTSEVKQKEIIHFSCYYLNYSIKNKILDFNKTNENYRIEVKSYEAYEDGAKQLNLDIASGDVPDVLDIYSVSSDQMIKKGLFTDLYALMENDEEIHKEDFLPSIIETLENDGKLYYMPSYFYIQTLVAGKKTVGDIESWTMDDMMKLYEEMPKNAIFMQYMTRQYFVQSILSYQISDYVNWSTGEVKFDSDDFIKLIEFANNFPDEEDYEYNYQESMPTLVQSGKLILNTIYLNSLDEIELYTKLYKKQGGFSILSFPSENKSNKIPMSFSNGALAITEQCENKEGAWEFVRQFLTYDYQKSTDMYSGFPTRKDALDKKIEYAQATEPFTDDDGTEVQPISSGYGYDDYEVTLGPISEEEAEIIRSMVDRVGICVSYDTINDDIYNIITEEMKAYFTGDKSAKETAEVIQSRVKIYVSENS